MDISKFTDDMEEIYSSACEVVARATRKGILILIIAGAPMFVEAKSTAIQVSPGIECIISQDSLIYSQPAIIDTQPINVSNVAKNWDLDALSMLQDGWDGDGSIAPSEQTVSNARRIFELLKKSDYPQPEMGDSYATSYGSIVMDIKTEKGLVSVEVGTREIGFYTDFKDEKNISLEATETDFSVLPESLVRAFA